jgi:mono/diheme cytochrome c family protein
MEEGWSMLWLLRFAILLASGVAAQAQSPVERGKYLVDTVMTCHNCHTPMGPNGPQFDKALSGGLRFNEPPFDVTGSNLTPDPETGLGKWSDADIKKALRDGVKPDGTQIAGVMPTAFYKVITPGDLDGIVAYLRSLPPVTNKVRDPIYKMQIPHQVFPGAEQQMSDAGMSDKLKRGYYLVTIAHCMECHTPFGSPGSGIDYGNSLGQGGREFRGPWGVSVSRNITPSKTKGIGDWSDADIKRAITQGVRKDGTKLKPPMGYPYYGRMTDADLDAMVAYLRTVPAKD